ncbi:MAG: bifunctional hydroxymethylpyrimidine kinase/phosphomethylpyrimidine kinase [Clostridiales bacterium]|jgi:pyridoxine kinase|nr:bifunctional hydroxymethylpyrimidine kinase/phosphomethylpyrimidine kinase [Clostridiales bacterium]
MSGADLGRLKRICVIGDMTGFGRCALAVQLPAICAMGVQACPLPTAVISAIPYHDSHYYLDLSDGISDYANHWTEIGITFDALLAGFMCSSKEIRVITDYIRRLNPPIVVVDPVMGDGGHLYSKVKGDVLPVMRTLAGLGGVITPNLTEACALAGVPYRQVFTDAELDGLLERLQKLTPGAVIVKSVCLENDGETLNNILLNKGRTTRWAYEPKPGKYHGCGDFFAAALTGGLVLGDSLEDAFLAASQKTSQAVSITYERGTPPDDGILFELTL